MSAPRIPEQSSEVKRRYKDAVQILRWQSAPLAADEQKLVMRFRILLEAYRAVIEDLDKYVERMQ